jgi:preprotein translocase subunit YajC
MDYSLLLILAAFMAFIIFSNRKRTKAAKQLAESVAVGANVVMLCGITGKITAIKEDSVIVETTPGVRIEFVKAAVRNVVSPSLDNVVEPKIAPKAAPTKAKAAVAKTTTAKTTTTKKAAK